jgi:hypothetical protein
MIQSLSGSITIDQFSLGYSIEGEWLAAILIPPYEEPRFFDETLLKWLNI